jgi:murein L,D-transpeptidase YcbB/YkuD
VVFVGDVATASQWNVPTDEEIRAVASRLQRPNNNDKHWDVVVRLYQHRGSRPLWIAHGKPTERVQSLLLAFDQAPLHGLEIQNYKSAPLADPIDQELSQTQALVRFAFDVAGPHDFVEERLTRAIDEDALPALADQLAPKHVEYRNLMRGLQQYEGPQEGLRQIRLNMQRLRELPEDLGDRYIRVNIPEYRLAVIENGNEVLSMNVVVGKVETPTPTLNSKMTHIVFSPYWNIPESILTKETLPHAVRDENYLARQNIEIIRVSDGAHEIVNPSEIDWSDAATAKEYRFRQKPGAANSLGLVKFMFPNKYNVYLHDTPADSLFQRAERDFSHGCVRVELPMELTTYLLADQPKWTERAIKSAMHSGDEQTVKLSKPIPVHILYLTAWGTPDGTVHFAKDIYQKDEEKEIDTSK